MCVDEAYVAPSLTASLLRKISDGSSVLQIPTTPLESLTDRERQILEGAVAGLSNREKGRCLHLSERTVKHKVTSILRQLQVRNRVEVVLLVERDRQPDDKGKHYSDSHRDIPNTIVGRRPIPRRRDLQLHSVQLRDLLAIVHYITVSHEWGSVCLAREPLHGLWPHEHHDRRER